MSGELDRPQDEVAARLGGELGEKATAGRLALRLEERILQRKLSEADSEAREGVELDMDRLNEQLQEAFRRSERDSDEIQGISFALSVAAAHEAQIKEIKDGLSGFAGRVMEVFAEYGIETDEDIGLIAIEQEDLRALLGDQAGGTAEDADGGATEPKEDDEKKSKYRGSMFSHVANALIARDNEGNYLYSSLRDIGVANLKSEEPGKKERHAAGEFARQQKVRLQETIYIKAEELSVRKVVTLVEKRKARLAGEGRVEDPNMTGFYDAISDRDGPYAGMKVKDFVEEVLGRFDVKESKGKEREKEKGDVKPSDVTEKTEAVLANILTRDGVLEEVAAKLGFEDSGDVAQVVREEIDEGSERLAQKRDGTLISLSDDEKRQQQIIIEKSLWRMVQNSRGWHMLPPEFESFKFLRLEAVRKIRESDNPTNTLQSLIKTLFPREKMYVLDPHTKALEPAPGVS